MGSRQLVGAVAATAALLAAAGVAWSLAVNERQLIAAGPLRASVEDRADWCQPLVDIAIRADKVERFQNDRLELQRVLGRVRAILELECPSVSVIRITGLVDDVFIYDGTAPKDLQWILTEVPVALSQVPEPSQAPAPPPSAASPSQGQAPSPASPAPKVPRPNAVAECDAVAAHPGDPGLVAIGYRMTACAPVSVRFLESQPRLLDGTPPSPRSAACLAVVSSASAECAWVLWKQTTSPVASWELIGAHATMKECSQHLVQFALLLSEKEGM